MKLLIVTPAYDPMVWLDTYAATVALDKCGMDVECFCPQGHTVAKARTLAARHALDIDADWMLCIDSDNVLPRDALANLLSHDVDVCFGYYQSHKRENGATCLYEPGIDYRRRFAKDELHAMCDRGKRLVEVRGGGFGCVLIRCSVFERVPRPWFEYAWSEDGQKLSEDYGFCNRCRSAGIRLYADTRVDCGHVKQVVA